MISKERLVDLYLEKKLTPFEIAELLKVETKAVLIWLEKYGIEVSNPDRKYYHIRRVPLTREQKEFVVGSLLGRGKLEGKNKLYRLVIQHRESDKELVLWKKDVMGNLVNVINKRLDKKSHTLYHFNTAYHNEFRVFEKMFYDNCKKIITESIAHYLTPFALAVWYMDAGSLVKNVSMRLSTEIFSQEDNLQLQRMLKVNFNLRSKVCEYKKNNKSYYYLSFNKENSKLFANLIDRYVIEGMSYKMPNRSSTTTCLASNQEDDIV
jgi:hypothetical protein